MEYIPHIEIFLHSLRINRARLAGKTKIAIEAKMLRHLLQRLAEAAPFSDELYLQNNPDVARAHANGQIANLHGHFVEQGYFEGRCGTTPIVNETYYANTYADVADAVRRGDVASCSEHYLRSGAAEGRIPDPQVKDKIEAWTAVLSDDALR